MRKAKVRTDFSKVADSEIDNEAGTVKSAIHLNPNFVLTDVGYTETSLGTAITEYTDAKNAAASGDHAKIATKNTKKRTLVSILGHIGRQVNEQGNGDVPKLQSSGFPMADLGGPVHLVKPTGQKVERGANSGDVKCTVDAFRKGHGFVWFFTEASDAETDPNHWEHQFSTAHTTTIHDLTAGTSYKVCCSYQGATNEAYIFSDVTTIMAA